MSLRTANKNGRIYITTDAIAMITNYVAMDCYGVLQLVSQRLSDSILTLFNKPVYGQGVKVSIVNNIIYIDVYVVLKSGVSVNAVKESLINAITYVVESYTGMRVNQVTVNIVGMRA